jgi:hypothetical protein
MTRSNSPAPAIPLEVILPRIIQQCLCEGDPCRGLAVKSLARAFEVQPKDIRQALEKGRQFRKDVESTLRLKWTPSNT